MKRKPNASCEFCSKKIYRRPKQIKESSVLCCSRCRATANTIAATNRANKQYEEYIRLWKIGEKDGMKGSTSISRHIRKYLFNKYNDKCSKCSWGEKSIFTNKIPLEINHIDGNYKNNKENNLELLCPNCHSLTYNYKSMNKGNGRRYDTEYKRKCG